jgi:hypothetical protein
VGPVLTRRARREARRAVAFTGTLLPVDALSEDGLLVRADGTLVRYLEVLPRNPLVLDADGAERLTAGFAALLSQLPAAHAAQFYVFARPLKLDLAIEQFVGQARAALQAAARAGELDGPAGMALERLAYVHAESLRRHAIANAAVDVRYLVVLPMAPHGGRTPLPFARPGVGWGSRSRPERERAARASLALADRLHSELDALDMGARLLDGRAVAAVLAERFSAPERLAPSQPGPRWLSGIELARDERAMREAALRLRERLCRGAIDARHRRWLVVDGGLEQTLA